MPSSPLTIINGEISYYVRKCNLSKADVDIQVIASSLRWSNFDIEFEYRHNSEEQWRTDANITFTSANRVIGNRIYGLKTSEYGYINLIRWNFDKNFLTYGTSLQLRINILPRIRNFALSIMNSTITETWGENGADLIGQSTSKKCIGINKSGQYICLTDLSISIFNSLSDTSPVYSYGGLLKPSHAVQTDSGHYIVADYGNYNVLELDETLSTLINSYSIVSPVFVDYDNVNKTTLVTSSGLNLIAEVSLDYSTVSWTSATSLLNPQSATYSLENSDEVVISDFGNNRIVVESKTNGLIETRSDYLLRPDSTNSIPFYHPYRAYKFNDKSLIVIEKDGKIVDFNYMPEIMSSSSSSTVEINSSSSTSSSTSSETSGP